MDSGKEKAPPLQLRLLADCTVWLWGLSSVERLRRQLRHAGVAVSPIDSAAQANGAVLGGRPDLGLIAVGGWTVVSAAVLVGRLLQAAYERSTGERLQPWLRTEVAPLPAWAPERRSARTRF
jgi:hypothetical protein